MRFHKEFELPGTPAQVRAITDDAAFREEVAREAGATEVSVTVEELGDGTVSAVLDSRQPSTGLPTIATKILGSDLAIHQEEHWHTLESATLLATVPHQPGKVTGTITLTERDGVTVQTVDADVKVHIPLLGGKVEKLIGSVLGHVLKIQTRMTAERLTS